MLKVKKSTIKVFDDLSTIEKEVILDTSQLEDLTNQLLIIGLGNRDLAIAKKIQPFIQEHLDTITTNYYNEIQKEASLLKIIKDNSTVDRLKKTLTRHLFELFDGKIDHNFINQRITIAHVHVKIGLKTKWYMAAFQSLFSTFVEILNKYILDKDELLEAIHVVSKLLNLEQQLVLEAYEEEVERIKKEEQAKKQIRERVTQNVQDLSAIAEETSVSVLSLSKKTGLLVELATSGVQSAEKVEHRSKEGKLGIDEQLAQMNTISENSIHITKEVEDLQRISSEINEVVILVKEIADQLNLLALNASIESARAGVEGRGFSVVANEVKKLAEKTKSSVSNVSDLIKKTNVQIENVNSISIGVNELVQTGFQNMNTIARFFDSILKEVEHSKLENKEMESELLSFSHHFDEIQRTVGYLAQTTDGIRLITQDL
ncbi:MAG: methyl-accepting chemotaxis protein [Bacillales bacterium]|jgi:heme-based aerotactic transducer|nr:methyl-accepting chemotaxis protein [Bacillales bacterium]